MTTQLPTVDILKNDQEILLLVDLPGIAKDRTELEIVDDDLVIRATPAEETEAHPDVRLLKREFQTVAYERRFTLPEEVDRDKVRAESKEGVLWVHLPRRQDDAPKRITIH